MCSSFCPCFCPCASGHDTRIRTAGHLFFRQSLATPCRQHRRSVCIVCASIVCSSVVHRPQDVVASRWVDAVQRSTRATLCEVQSETKGEVMKVVDMLKALSVVV